MNSQIASGRGGACIFYFIRSISYAKGEFFALPRNTGGIIFLSLTSGQCTLHNGAAVGFRTLFLCRLANPRHRWRDRLKLSVESASEIFVPFLCIY